MSTLPQRYRRPQFEISWPSAATADENRVGSGGARSCLVRTNPRLRLTPLGLSGFHDPNEALVVEWVEDGRMIAVAECLGATQPASDIIRKTTG